VAGLCAGRGCAYIRQLANCHVTFGTVQVVHTPGATFSTGHREVMLVGGKVAAYLVPCLSRIDVMNKPSSV